MDQLAVCLLIFAVTVIGYCSGLYKYCNDFPDFFDCPDAYRMSECKAGTGILFQFQCHHDCGNVRRSRRIQPDRVLRAAG